MRRRLSPQRRLGPPGFQDLPSLLLRVRLLLLLVATMAPFRGDGGRTASFAYVPPQQQQSPRVRWTNCLRHGRFDDDRVRICASIGTNGIDWWGRRRRPLLLSGSRGSLRLRSSVPGSFSSFATSVLSDEGYSNDDVTETPLTNDDNDDEDYSTPSDLGSGSTFSPSHLLDQFAALLHESLTNAAAHEGGAARQSSATEHGQEKPNDSKLPTDASLSNSCAQFQSLVVDFAAPAPGSSTAQRTKKNPASPNPNVPPVPGSVKRITGRLVRLAQVGGKRQRHKKTPGNDDASPSSQNVVLQVTHKYHGATDIVKNYPVDTASQSLSELLNWLLLHVDRQHEQHHDEAGEAEDGDSVGGDVPDTVRSVATEWGITNLVPLQLVTMRATLDTAAGRYVLTVPPRSGARKQQQPRPSLQHLPSVAGPAPETAIRDHDRPRNRKVCIEDDFWRSVGVTTTTTTTTTTSGSGPRAAAVNVKPDMIAKVRQCEKFVEIVSNLVREVITSSGDSPNGGPSSLPAQPAIRITDLGCGKGYLTYALHSYLQKQQRPNGDESNGALYSNVTSIGIDVRPKLVRELNQIASDLRIDGLRFEQGSIQDACLGDAIGAPTSDEPLQVFIALHACDTATDDALFSAIQRGADVIVTAPCCHKQLRPQINDLIVGGRASKNVHPLADVLRHGIYRERTSETVTDAIRAMLLELAGYKTSVFEFVGGEHTAKNCMITGVRSPKRSTLKDQEDIRNRIRSLAGFYGIRHHQLADWMGEQSLLMPSERNDEDGVASPTPGKRSIRTMPPL